MPIFVDKNGQQQEVTLNADIYRAAKDANLTVRQYINQKYPTAEEVDTFTQMCASEGLFFKQDTVNGVNSTPLKAVLDPSPLEAANTTRETPVQSRLLFPPALISAMEDVLPLDTQSPVQVFDQLVALKTTVPSARVEQPIISYKGNDGPEEARSQRISQLTEPPNMLIMTASEITRQIPTFSLGLAVSDEVMQYATLDLVALSIARQKDREMFALAGEALLEILNGDVDNGQSALPTVTAASFDSSIAAAGELTHKAWIKWLYSDILTRRIDWVIVDSIDTALAVEGRAGKPTVQSDDPNSPRIDTLFNMAYPTIAADVRMFVAPTEWSLPANTIIGLQSDSAIAKYINSTAEYNSAERWALRKGEAIRMDFSQLYFRLFDDAFSVLSLTV